MTKILISPSGNREIWADDATPEGYCTPEQWALAHPAPPPPPIPLDQAQEAKQAEINAEKDRRIDAGATYNGVLYDSDITAQTRITGAALQLSLMANTGQTAPPVEWIAMDNSVHALTIIDLIGLGQAISTRLSACVLAANAHKAAIAKMTDADAVQAYDYSAGWPS